MAPEKTGGKSPHRLEIQNFHSSEEKGFELMTCGTRIGSGLIYEFTASAAVLFVPTRGIQQAGPSQTPNEHDILKKLPQTQTALPAACTSPLHSAGSSPLSPPDRDTVSPPTSISAIPIDPSAFSSFSSRPLSSGNFCSVEKAFASRMYALWKSDERRRAAALLSWFARDAEGPLETMIPSRTTSPPVTERMEVIWTSELVSVLVI